MLSTFAFLLAINSPKISFNTIAHQSAFIKEIDVDLSKQMLYEKWSDGRKVVSIEVSTGQGNSEIKNYCSIHHNAIKNCTPTGTFSIRPVGGYGFKDTEGYLMNYYSELSDIPGKPHSRSATNQGIGIHSSQIVDHKIIKGHLQPTTDSHGCIRIGKSHEADIEAKTIHDNINKKTIVKIYGNAPSPNP